MSVVANLREYLFQRSLRKFRSTNLGSAPDNHFGQISKVGIVFDAHEAKDREVVLQYAERLRKNGMQVWVFGFFNSKIDGVTFPFDYLDITQLSFARLPKGEKIGKFIATKFDLLINLDLRSHPTVEYIAAASAAYFKIGPASGNQGHYDLMVEVDRGSLSKYIESIRTVFNKIKG